MGNKVPACTKESQAMMNPDSALNELKAGNQRFRSHKQVNRDLLEQVSFFINLDIVIKVIFFFSLSIYI